MGYTLKAYIGKEENLIPILEKYNKSQKIDLKNGISIIPMTHDFFDEINETKSSSVISTFEFLTEDIEQKIIEIIGNRELAYVESEFFGGQGGHIGILWRNRKRDFLTEFDKNSMNKILKKLGVNKSLLKDEFETVRFIENRSTEDWVKEKY